MESVLWASEGFNRSAATANSGMLSPHEVFLGAARLCSSCCSANRRTIVSPGGVKLAPRRARVFPEFGVQSCKRLPQDHERGDRKGRALARRHMAPVGGTAHFPGPDSRTGRALFIIRCRNAKLRVYPANICSYCHACRPSSCRRTGACTSRRCSSTRAAIKPPSINSRSRCSGTGA